MTKFLTIIATLALSTAPALAEGITGGVFGGVAQSHSSGGSFASTAGYSTPGTASGRAFVRNEQSPGQLAGAFGSYEGASNGRLTKGTIVTETFTDGFSESRTLTRNNGGGTWGSGDGWATNFGDADAVGGFVGGGFATNW